MQPASERAHDLPPGRQLVPWDTGPDRPLNEGGSSITGSDRHLGSELERELAANPGFGDSGPILKRRNALYEFAVDVLADRIPGSSSPISRILSLPAEQRARALGDPLLRAQIHEALRVLPDKSVDPPEQLEITFRTIDPGTGDAVTLQREMPEQWTLGDDDLWVWTLPVGARGGPIVESFKTLVAEELLEDESRAGASREGALMAPDERRLELLREGYDLLFELTPWLGRSVLDHARMVAWMPVETAGTALVSESTRAIPGSIFLSSHRIRTPWAVAEALLHEAAHQKLFDLVMVRPIVEAGYDHQEARRIVAHWNPSTPAGDNEWPVDHALAAFHVYVHLAVLDVAIKSRAGELSDRFGELDTSDAMRCSLGAERAEYLGEELKKHDYGGLGPEGRRLAEWLSDGLRTMQSAAATTRGGSLTA